MVISGSTIVLSMSHCGACHSPGSTQFLSSDDYVTAVLRSPDGQNGLVSDAMIDFMSFRGQVDLCRTRQC